MWPRASDSPVDYSPIGRSNANLEAARVGVDPPSTSLAVIALVVIVAVFLLVFIVPAVTTAVVRNVMNTMKRDPSSGSIDQSLVEARLGRIEEAIDAMAVEIERLSDDQRALRGSPSEAAADEPSRLRTES